MNTRNYKRCKTKNKHLTLRWILPLAAWVLVIANLLPTAATASSNSRPVTAFGVTIDLENMGCLEESRYITLLKKELAFYYRMEDYKTIRDILYDELSDHPLQALPILEYILSDRPVFNFSMSNGPLTVILDNSRKWPVEVSIGNNTKFIIKEHSSRQIQLDPGYHSLVFFIDELDYLEEIRLPVISPPGDKHYLIYNIGNKNSYRISHFETRKELRKNSDKTRGWPHLLRTPKCFWIECTELFPQRVKLNIFARLGEAEKAPPVKTLFRLSSKNR